MTGPALAGHVARARRLLAAQAEHSRSGYAARCGQLEAMLKMIADSAAAVLQDGRTQLDNSTEVTGGASGVRPDGSATLTHEDLLTVLSALSSGAVMQAERGHDALVVQYRSLARALGDDR